MQDKLESVAAGFPTRAAAFLADRLLLLLALAFIRTPAAIVSLFDGGKIDTNILFRFTAVDIICYVLTAAYFILLTYFTGSTLGKKLMHIHVETADGTPLRLVDVIYRETIGRYLSGILLIGYFMALVDRKKRAFHDYLCDSRVVYDDRVMCPGSEEKSQPRAAEYTVPGETEGQEQRCPLPLSEEPAETPEGGSVSGSEEPAEFSENAGLSSSEGPADALEIHPRSATGYTLIRRDRPESEC